jgi:hypothetical protein
MAKTTEMVITTKYAVFWTERKRTDNDITTEFDYYSVFIDSDSAGNSLAAKQFYRGKLELDEVTSAHLCIIMESTDYTLDAKKLLKERLNQKEQQEEEIDDSNMI